MKFNVYNDVFDVSFKALFKLWLTLLFGLPKDSLVKPFHSHHYEFSFFRFADYFIEVGKRESLVDLLAKQSIARQGPVGYTEEEVLQKFARTLMGNLPCVILYEFNYADIGRLWDRFPGIDRAVFQDDYVVFQARTKASAQSLVNAVPPTMARALGFSCGELFCANYY